MIYSNNDPMAISAMEIARTGNYGEYDYEAEVLYKNIFNNEIVGCNECIKETYENE